MRTSWLNGPGDVTVVEVDEPVLIDGGDVVVDILFAAICGSDLWAYRGTIPRPPGSTGHEFLGRVREVGSDVRDFAVGDAVVAPFVFSDGTCDDCLRGLQPFCAQGGLWGKNGPGAHAESIRVPFADATLVRLPWAAESIDADLARKLLPLADVWSTGTHGAALARVASRDTVAVIGDGAVGIAAASAARSRGAQRVILLGEQESRLAIARGFGVETLQVSRDEPAVEAYLELTHGVRPDRVIECVGLPASFATALDLVRPGGDFGFVGVPHGPEAVPPSLIFDKGLRIAGGPAPARVYLPGLVGEVAAGTLDPSALMNATVPLADIAAGFEAMHTGAALKVMIRTREQSVTRTPGASIDARTER